MQSKIPLPISKGISKDPGSDDESIMRKVRSLDVDVNDEIGLNVLKIYITFDRFLIDSYYTIKGGRFRRRDRKCWIWLHIHSSQHIQGQHIDVTTTLDPNTKRKTIARLTSNDT